MRARDPEDKKRRLLDAALTEFAANGLAGTRIDAVSARAGCSTGLVYTYFGSKEVLFDSVLADITARTVDQAPITVDDLPGYAVRLYEASAAHPEIERFVAWYQLEREGLVDQNVTAATQEKVDKVAAAQREGLLPDRLGAAELVLAIQTIARSWLIQPRAVALALDPIEDHRVRGEAVRRVVAELIARH
ncbi:TetR family transcriptional regulator [Nocardiopsis sp. CT-R113]|uniref:TetR family transcriptional regulator n=1 Tax=Nocardiopsis codii TaxID=3065942 RepID=A0ABU7KBA8_9ACTN|nr:TetR family transcriptional regulator [Nocardiopsis sp. CT-R113]MEE2039510.1 TetR family transcriptional regulator [Nocardiopsis sp. CT-R113]